MTSMVLMTEAGASFDINTSYVGGANGVKIWVDWDNDNWFGSNEELAFGQTSGANQTFNVSIPSDVADGQYRMRVRGSYGPTANPAPYGSSSWGLLLISLYK